ncbi:MAG: excinuclease ABC subunit UvrA [Gemmatimonadetes bacterium]|nr:excinuclease ABC subunit UvrA [Gemmatimonadota bacterium]NIO32574.1 excinuclease ABC subunit UvrA [Gemmatimonadota bacterium]
MHGEFLIVRGAREHNLKNIDVRVPRNELTVITGLSGSGKSSLAFDTIYAEGQRRYVESLSAYARQFLGLMEKPDVDSIEGLSPAISIEQKTAGRNPRSTVGTITEIYDYLRLLWARCGTPHCPSCSKPIRRQTPEQVADAVLSWPEKTRIEVLAPLVRGRKGEFRDLFERARKDGFVRVRVDGDTYDLNEPPKLNRRVNHDIAIVVDRLSVRAADRARLTDSIELALRSADGVVQIDRYADGGERESQLFSERYACPDCGINLPELEPRQFSFNSPYGACPACGGLGVRKVANPDLMLADSRLSLLEGVLIPWGSPVGFLRKRVIEPLARKHGIGSNTPWSDLPEAMRKEVLFGSDDLEWEGALARLERRYHETASDRLRARLSEFMSDALCSDCGGARLRGAALAVTFEGVSIGQIVGMTAARVWEFFATRRSHSDDPVAGPILKQIVERLQFLHDVGVSYLTLGRSAESLSGGEAQRIRLATQIGSRLVGVLYILDEPSIGLHQRDNAKLLSTLESLRDLGNTVIVVEHDEATIRRADHVVDLGPGAGRSGGEVVAQGKLDDVLTCQDSLTGAYLRGERKIDVPKTRRPGSGEQLVVRGARQYNLKNIDVGFPLGCFICVTGVSGSGKSTLVEEILYRELARRLYRSRLIPGDHEGFEGLEHIEKVIDVDQSPIGRTPRSNPATYAGVFTPIRQLFAQLPESRMRGYEPGRFSFNVKGGRCEACQGDGLVKIEMHFLPDVYVSCEVCRGRRYNRETLEVFYKGKNVADVLAMTVDEALEFFQPIPTVRRKLQTLRDVGLGYLTLGQSSTTLSGGEAQRVKLATELSKVQTGRTLYILDEPTTGLHFEDIRMLLDVLHRLVDHGNTVVVIEHQLDVIKTADWVVDLGPEGGDEGGEIVATGTPEEVARVKGSFTGQFLRPLLDRRKRKRREAEHVGS